MESHAKAILSQYLHPIASYMDDGAVQEIMVNRPDDIWVERNGVVQKVDAAFDRRSLRSAIKVLGRMVDRDVEEDSENAILDAHLGDLRVGAVLHPVAYNGDAVAIRKHGRSDAPLSSFAPDGNDGQPGSLTDTTQDDMLEYLKALVRAKKNILVAGGTSTGKTTFLNALLREVPDDERLLVIEDTAELNIKQPNQIRLVANPRIGIDARILLRLALRMRPDRIVVGEVRGGEAFDLMQAWNTGHDGGAASIHASSPEGAIRRLETLVLTANTGWPIEAIHHAVIHTVDYIVHLIRRRGRRQIAQIVKVADLL